MTGRIFIAGLLLLAVSVQARDLLDATVGAGNEAVPTCKTAYQVISDLSFLSTLKKAVDDAGLAATLDDATFAGTLFAPTDEAVNVCYAPGCMTANTLLNHLIPGAILNRTQLINFGNPSTYIMGNGGLVSVAMLPANAQLDSATFQVSGFLNKGVIVLPNFKFCNGYIHVINVVLQPGGAPVARSPSPPPALSPSPAPPSPSACTSSAYQTISAMPALAGFKALIDRTGYAPVFSDLNFQGTIFAPTWCHVGPYGSNEALAVRNHILNGTLLSAPTPLAGSNFTVLSGKKVSVQYDNSPTLPVTPINLFLVLDGYTNYVDPSRTNIGACSYIMHVVAQTFWDRPPLGK